jgi:hypothetical protein
MKVTHIPGMGSFGAFVDDFEWDQPDAYKELRDVNMKTLLTVVRGKGQDNFMNLVEHSPNLVTRRPNRWSLKYNVENPIPYMDEEEKRSLELYKYLAVGNHAPGWHRVSGKTTDKGELMGIFGDTELGWHSNEFMSYDFSPLVVLYGSENMTNSATSFFQTVDWYNRQTESFKSVLDELICICKYEPRKVIPNGRDKDIEMVKLLNNTGKDFRIPLVFTSPGGHKGLHYGHFVTGFEGMSQQESDKILGILEKYFFESGDEYDYWWANDTGDMLLFDNSVMMHRRKMDPKLYGVREDMTARLHVRIGHRITGDYAEHEDYNGFTQPEFREYRQQTIDKLLSGSWKN